MARQFTQYIIYMTAYLTLALGTAFSEEYSHFGTALRGYDAVAYHTQNEAIEGDANFAEYHDGLTYLFASKSNAKKFKKNPAAYVPAYNGYCAKGVALGKKLPSSPHAFKVVGGVLYMNLNDSVQKLWLKDIEGNIEEANANWSEIQSIHPSKL